MFRGDDPYFRARIVCAAGKLVFLLFCFFMYAQKFEKLFADVNGVSDTWVHLTHEANKAALHMAEKVEARAFAHTEVMQPCTCR